MLCALELIARWAWTLLSAFFGVALVLLSLASVQAQSGGGIDQTGTGGRHTIQGRIYFPSGRRSDVRVLVRLESYNAGDLSVLSDSNGSFRFSGLNPGAYKVIVDAGDEYEVARESVYVDTDGSNSRSGMTLPPISRLYTIQISLRLKASATTKPGVVNAALAAIPASALDLYQKALESVRLENSSKAIEQLQGAIAIHADFPLALNALGVEHLKLGQADKASEALSSAVQLAPEDFSPRLNYGIALLNQKKFAAAEEQLRTALKRSPSDSTAHLYLGITLAISRKLDEAEKELQIVVDSKSGEVGLAHRYLAGVYLERRQYKRAANELEAYLKLVPKASDAGLTRQKIKELRARI